ncbi:MAG: hypothetical protein FJ102_26735 [Deltaproteobacteria bacterium]|nr:hypothetical protein [Deltaproteobacteria bacterium]
MLDGYIIGRIQKQREAAEAERAPMRISIPQPPPASGQREADDVRPRDNDDPAERGVVDVDFSI